MTEDARMIEEPAVVHVVDDDPAFLEAMSRMLQAAGYRVRQYQSAAEFSTQRVPGRPGCVLADLRMPGRSGLDLQAELAADPEPLPVIILTAHGDIPSTVQAMKRGAEDFLTKLAPKEDLFAAVERALARDARDRAARQHIRELQGRLATLTPRERQVLDLVVQGRLNKQIAAELGIHERTVKLHRTAITTKLQVPSVAQLTRLVQEAGLLP